MPWISGVKTLNNVVITRFIWAIHLHKQVCKLSLNARMDLLSFNLPAHQEHSQCLLRLFLDASYKTGLNP